MSKAPKVKQIHVQVSTVKQSKYEVCGNLPIHVILDIYRNCFSRIFVLRPNIEVDMTWGHV